MEVKESASRVETQRDQMAGQASLAVPSALSPKLLVLPLALSALEIYTSRQLEAQLAVWLIVVKDSLQPRLVVLRSVPGAAIMLMAA